MVNVTDGTDVTVVFGSVKFLLSHFFIILLKWCSKITVDNYTKSAVIFQVILIFS